MSIIDIRTCRLRVSESRYHLCVFGDQPEAVVLGVPRIVGHEHHQPDQGGGIGDCSNREFDGRDSPAAADMASLDDLPM
jgi:hypothetical protein